MPRQSRTEVNFVAERIEGGTFGEETKRPSKLLAVIEAGTQPTRSGQARQLMPNSSVNFTPGQIPLVTDYLVRLGFTLLNIFSEIFQVLYQILGYFPYPILEVVDSYPSAGMKKPGKKPPSTCTLDCATKIPMIP